MAPTIEGGREDGEVELRTQDDVRAEVANGTCVAEVDIAAGQGEMAIEVGVGKARFGKELVLLYEQGGILALQQDDVAGKAVGQRIEEVQAIGRKGGVENKQAGLVVIHS
ncbi:hypothetical protein GCWU000325_02220 [Alloprevotella tannerae ATCC 51259]|uniref:Uncharacterized protein n=1 Tax=Alloprevotella tannerae ATCC 51259 TaxID=626522 RepID=C9LJ08_9BACT|nr:hypothetical protein GCWU000325_02220 [Alloprevotella tannerae ATCC 51259]